MIPPYLHFHAVVTKVGAFFHHPITASGLPSSASAKKHLENNGYTVVSSHGSYGEAEMAAQNANASATPLSSADTTSIADVALNAPAMGSSTAAPAPIVAQPVSIV